MSDYIQTVKNMRHHQASTDAATDWDPYQEEQMAEPVD